MFIKSINSLLLLVCLFSNTLLAAECGDIWPDRDTSNTTVFPTLPAFTGTNSLSLPATLGAGDFQYSSTTDTSGDLTVNGGASTRIYINGNFILGGSADLNQGGNPEDLIIIVNGDLNFNNAFGTVYINAIIYATGNVNLNNDAYVTGSVTAAGNINNAHRISYDANAVANADFGTLCGGTAPVLKLVSPVCSSADTLVVTFDDSAGQEILSSSAEITSNYSLVNSVGSPITITDAELADNGYEVILTLASSLVDGTNYTLTVSNIADESGNTLASASDDVYYASSNPGIPGAYFNNSTLTDPVTLYQVDSEINDSWGAYQTPFGSGTSGFSMRWEGYFEPATTGSYQFRTYSDDGVRLWVDDINGSSVIDNWTDHVATYDTSAAMTLTAGERYPVKLEYYNRSANNELGEIRLDRRLNGGGYSAVSSEFYTCVVAPEATNGLVVHYQLDGPVWNGTANEVLDSSGLNVHGNTINSPTNAPAQVCNGAYMDGSNFLRIPDNNELDLTDELTVTAWINLTQFSSELRTILSKDENYEFHIDNDGSIYWWWNSNAGTRSFDTGSTRITLGQWHHVAIVYADGRQSIYLDGVEEAFRTYSGEILVTNGDPLEIGADQGLTNRNWVGAIDEVKIYKNPLTPDEVLDVMNETRVCPSTLDSFTVNAAATASVCAPTAVTFTALESDGSTYTDYIGTVNISTSTNHGDWSLGATANGVLSPNPDNDDNGVVQYTFGADDNGVVELSLSNTHSEQLTVTVEENGGTAITGISNTIAFTEDAIFQIDVVDVLGSDFVAGRNHDLQIQALRRDPDSNICGVFTDYDGEFDLKAWVVQSGVFSVAGDAPAITTTTTNVLLSDPAPDAEPATNNVTLNFSSGVATTEWVTTDVGQYTFHLKDDSSAILNTNNDAAPIEGSSTTFTVRPFGLYVEASGNPAALDHTGSTFVKAAEPFPVNVTAVVHEALDDINDDGFPDAGADLSGNSATPSFGKEGESVVLSSALLLPIGGSDPALAGTTTLAAASFTNGLASATVQYNEVGIIRLDALDTSYLSTSHDISGVIENLGRFYPAYFDVSDNSPSLRDANGAWTCDFTYQGQDFGFDIEPAITVVARNVDGDTTNNYAGNFWKLAVPQHQLQLDVGQLPVGSACESGGAIVTGCFLENASAVNPVWSNTSNLDGTGILQVSNPHVLTIDKMNVIPDGGDIPYEPWIDYSLPIVDTDTACYLNGTSTCTDYTIDDIQGTEIRWGRGWVDSALGSVLTPLPSTLRIQYWNASSVFQLNEDDDFVTCTGTNVQVTDLALDNYSGNLSSGETSVSGVSANPGYYVMTLSAPGYQLTTPNAGSVEITWAVDPWLQFDFDGDDVADDPTGIATFVAQPGNQPVLFKRESYR